MPAIPDAPLLSCLSLGICDQSVTNLCRRRFALLYGVTQRAARISQPRSMPASRLRPHPDREGPEVERGRALPFLSLSGRRRRRPPHDVCLASLGTPHQFIAEREPSDRIDVVLRRVASRLLLPRGWGSGRPRRGRPSISQECRELIHQLARERPAAQPEASIGDAPSAPAAPGRPNLTPELRQRELPVRAASGESDRGARSGS